MVKLKLPTPVLPGSLELRAVLDALAHHVDPHQACAALTGGCVRDVWHGFEPRDIDIAVWNLPPAPLSWFHEAMLKMGFERVHNGQGGIHEAASDPEHERIGWVEAYKHLGTGRKVDILNYAPSISSFEQMVLSHDHNVNMFGARYEDDGQLHVYYPWHNMGRCYQMRDNVSELRRARVIEVCAYLGWTYWHPPYSVPKGARHLKWEMSDLQGNRRIVDKLPIGRTN